MHFVYLRSWESHKNANLVHTCGLTVSNSHLLFSFVLLIEQEAGVVVVWTDGLAQEEKECHKHWWANKAESSKQELSSQGCAVMVSTNLMSRIREKREAEVEFLKASRYSKWVKYVRVMACVRRFNNLIRKNSDDGKTAVRGIIIAKELEDSEKTTIRQTQDNLEKVEDEIEKRQLYNDSERIY